MLYRTRGAFGRCLQLPDGPIRIELYNISDGQLAGALPQVTSIEYDGNGNWIVINNYDSANPWTFSCSLYNMYIYQA